jgi:hypothetical protein
VRRGQPCRSARGLRRSHRFSAAANALNRVKIGDALQAWKLAKDNGDVQDEKDARNAIIHKLKSKLAGRPDPLHAPILTEFVAELRDSAAAP